MGLKILGSRIKGNKRVQLKFQPNADILVHLQ
jgi:hypothetical protein